MNWPDLKSLRFTDFKMADDIQRIQQLIALNSQNKVSDKTMLTEIGLDADEESKLIAQEMEIRNKLQEIAAKGQAKIAGESQLISYQYQKKMTEMQMRDQMQMQMQQQQIAAQQQMGGQPGAEQQGAEQQGMPGSPEEAAANEQAAASPMGGGGGSVANAPVQPLGLGTPAANEFGVQGSPPPGRADSGQVQPEMSAAPGGMSTVDTSARVSATTGAPSSPMEAADPNAALSQQVSKWALKLTKMTPTDAQQTIVTIREQFPSFGNAIERKYNEYMAQTQAAGNFGGPLANPTNVGNVNMGSPTGRGVPREGV
jgi:hypothetical protein